MLGKLLGIHLGRQRWPRGQRIQQRRLQAWLVSGEAGQHLLSRCAPSLLRLILPEFDPERLSDTGGNSDKEKPNTLKIELLRL